MAGAWFFATNFALFCHHFFPISSVVASKNSKNVKLGKQGEALAFQYLKSKGFKPIATNFRTRWGEIDIVAKRKKEYYFIEVKTRQNLDYGTPAESLPWFRQLRLKRMATYYVTQKKIVEKNLHLSLLGIDLTQTEPQITFIQNITE